jgi:alanine-glyoxylate transaminase/(R)-3-amino-2-methylpropionate-pyruvate transaminase
MASTLEQAASSKQQAAAPQMPECGYTPRPYDGPSRAEVLAMRKQFANPAIFTIYKNPIMIVEGHMQWLFDETGKRYLDMLAGIVTVSCGHCHPKVTKAIHNQVDRLQHSTTIYLHPGMPEFARKLASKMPPGLDVTYFVNSGSEANDLAIQIARMYTGNSDVIALRNAYHGASPFTNTLTSHSTWKYPVNPSGGIHHAINPDPYRSPFSGTPEEIATKSANDIRELIRFSTPGKVAAFIAEPIQGVGGTTHGAKIYLREA